MVKRLGGQRFCDAQPDCGTPEQLAAAWQDFCQAKYAATDREEQRPELEDLGPPSERSSQVPTDEELELCFSALKSSKAVGADELPVEVYRAAPSAKEALFDLVKRIFASFNCLLASVCISVKFAPVSSKNLLQNVLAKW